MKTAEEFIDSLDKVETYIGKYGYNDSLVCVEGADIVYDKKHGKIEIEIEIAQCRNGWTSGEHVHSYHSYTGSGGYAGGCWLDDKSAEPTKEQAIVVAIDSVVKSLIDYRDESCTPPNAKRDFNQHIEDLTALRARYGAPKIGTQLTFF